MVNLFPRRQGKTQRLKNSINNYVALHKKCRFCLVTHECIQIRTYEHSKLIGIEYKWHNRKELNSEFKITGLKKNG